MKSIAEEKTMTIRDVADALGYDSEYLRKKCAELGFTQNGKKTLLNEVQVTVLKNSLIPRTSDMKIRGQNAVTHLEMLQEKDDLTGKIKKAKSAIESNPYGMNKTQMMMLAEQVKYMENYLNILEERLAYEEERHKRTAAS